MGGWEGVEGRWEKEVYRWVGRDGRWEGEMYGWVGRFFVDSKVWPSKSVDPEELGTVYDGGINPADHVPLFLEDANPNPLVG